MYYTSREFFLRNRSPININMVCSLYPYHIYPKRLQLTWAVSITI